jgi:hypothetical protein
VIPPIPVTPATFRYTLDALRVRVRDLDRVTVLLASALTSIGSTTRTLFDTNRILLAADISSLARDVADVRDKLGGVIATIEPSEFARATLANGAPWSLLRPMSEWVTDRSPWWDAPQHRAPIRLTRSILVDAAPVTLADRLSRIPAGESRVRVDRFDSPDGPRFEVFIAGTEFGHGPNDPWWAGANAEMLSGGDSRSIAATESALRESGVTSSTPVVLTGHSQGGAIALALANSGRYRVDAVFTIATPVGLVDVPSGIPLVHVVHPEDAVPALGGAVASTRGTTWIVHPPSGALGVDAHFADTYRPSVYQIDRLADPALVRLERTIRATGEGTAMWFAPRTSG